MLIYTYVSFPPTDTMEELIYRGKTMLDGDLNANSSAKDSNDQNEERGAGSAADVRQAFLDDAGFSPKTAGSKTQAPEFDPSSGKMGEKSESGGSGPERTGKTGDIEKSGDTNKTEKTEKQQEKEEADHRSEAIRKFEQQIKEIEIAGIKQFLIDADKAHRQHDKDTGKESDWAEFYTKMLADKAGGMSAEDQKTLVDLFKAAGDAHGKFEEETGEEDKDWADWYARYIHERKNILRTGR